MKPLDRTVLLDSTAIVPIAFQRRIFDGSGIYKDVRPHGETIEEMVRSIPDLPERFWTRGVVCINGHEVERSMWHLVRPKPTDPMRPIAVTMHLPPAGGGGGGGGGKGGIGAVFGIIAAIGLTVVTGGIAAGFLAPLAGGLFAAGSISASLLAGAVGIAGALAISALTPPPAVAPAAATARENVGVENPEAASAQGNPISPGGAISRVLGTRKVFPPLACEPLVELVDDDEYVEAVYILNGPHALSDIRIGDASITTADDVEYQVREGWESDYPVDIVQRVGRTSQPGIELSTHKVEPEERKVLLHGQGAGFRDLPLFHTVSTKNSPDEVWVHLLLPGGMHKNGDFDNDKTIPFRIRLTRRGTGESWQLPEVHLSDRTATSIRRAFVFKWGLPDIPTPGVPTRSGFVFATCYAYDQNVAPVGSFWFASQFYGSDLDSSFTYWMTNGNESVTDLINTHLYENRVEFFLDPAIFPPGIWDIEIQRGYMFDTSNFDPTTYIYDGAIRDFFYFENAGNPQIHTSRMNQSEQVTISRVASVWNEPPIVGPGFATIAIKARNRRVESLSCLASGYVRDWNGSAWDTWTTTSNPAPHYVDVLSGSLNLDPLPADIRDDTGLVAWRTLCAAEDWTCDILAEDMRTQDVLSLIASCGYAKPYQSEQYGVVVDKDRSAEAPVQVFTPRNSSGFRWERSFPRLPDGFVVTFRDKGSDYDDEQEIVFRTGYSGGDSGLLEEIAYEGIVDRDKVIARAKFDLDQADVRGSFYYLDAPAEAILVRRGDLVAVQHDTLIRRTGTARIQSKTLSGGNIVGLVLDSAIPVVNELDMQAVANMQTVADMQTVGGKTGVVIRRTDGTLSSHLISTATSETKTVTLTTPIANTATIQGFADTNDQSASLLVSGDSGAEYRRCIVSGVTPGPDMRFSLTLVDEAPELVRG